MKSKKDTKTTEVKVRKTTVTPVQASNWLKSNTGNRVINERKVVDYLTQMKEGKWLLSTDAIGFDSNGKLINGQHRLHALVRANKDFDFMVAFGLPPKAFNVIDTGKIRSAGDILGVNGYKLPNLVASIIRVVMYYSRGLIGAMIKVSVGGAGRSITNQDILNFADKHEDVLKDVIDVTHMASKNFKGIQSRYIGGLYWILREINRDEAMLFFHYLSTGIGLREEDPIYLLRQKLINDMKNKRKLPDRDKLALCILAWNHTRKGIKIKKLQWGGDSSTAFPKPV